MNLCDLDVVLEAVTLTATAAVGAYASDLDEAIVAMLAADPQLAALCPDGVWFDVPPVGKKRYVIVSLFHYDAEHLFGGVAWEAFTYLVKAVDLQKTGRAVNAAARRIQRVMTTADLEVPGYALMLSRHKQYTRQTELDDVHDIRWQHRGGFYEVWVSPV